jgi:hypothetical protein
MNWECSQLHMEAYRQERQKSPVIARAQSPILVLHELAFGDL